MSEGGLLEHSDVGYVIGLLESSDLGWVQGLQVFNCKVEMLTV